MAGQNAADIVIGFGMTKARNEKPCSKSWSAERRRGSRTRATWRRRNWPTDLFPKVGLLCTTKISWPNNDFGAGAKIAQQLRFDANSLESCCLSPGQANARHLARRTLNKPTSPFPLWATHYLADLSSQIRAGNVIWLCLLWGRAEAHTQPALRIQAVTENGRA